MATTIDPEAEWRESVLSRLVWLTIHVGDERRVLPEPVAVRDLSERVQNYVCGPTCDYSPRRLCADNCHGFSTRAVPAEPNLLDLLYQLEGSHHGAN
jgi:hypothetical protein